MIPMTERQFDIAHQLLILAMIIVDSFVVRSLNQSQGGMCIFGVLRVGVGVAQQGVGP